MPRFEIPEYLWETLDRHGGSDRDVREWGSALHLNEVVAGLPNRYDGPGDFQMGLREDLFVIMASTRSMLVGWHVDSNIAKRLTMLRGKVCDLGKEIYGYHCDHARQVTLMHSHSRTENDWKRFIETCCGPKLPEQAKSWGCAGDEIEEIRPTVQSASAYVRALKKKIRERQSKPPKVAYVGENYNKTNYDPRHVLLISPTCSCVAKDGRMLPGSERGRICWRFSRVFGRTLVSPATFWLTKASELGRVWQRPLKLSSML